MTQKTLTGHQLCSLLPKLMERLGPLWDVWLVPRKDPYNGFDPPINYLRLYFGEKRFAILANGTIVGESGCIRDWGTFELGRGWRERALGLLESF